VLAVTSVASIWGSLLVMGIVGNGA
jgi:hypothetical protein